MFSVSSCLLYIMETIIDAFPEIRKGFYAEKEVRVLFRRPVEHNGTVIEIPIHLSSNPLTIRFAYISVTTPSGFFLQPFLELAVRIRIGPQQRIAAILFKELCSRPEIIHILKNMRMCYINYYTSPVVSRQVLCSWTVLTNHPL